MKGVVLIKILPGKEHIVLSRIREIFGVTEVEVVFGRWDLVIKVSANDPKALSDAVIKRIRSIEGIENTETLISTDL